MADLKKTESVFIPKMTNDHKNPCHAKY